ncbi:MAG: DegV family EDD domain-containing protein [Candidatus Aminicenantes bacterium]|nr:DegV family EDD domain-containing protein [Candidatus Aminicenantes bacterium]
MEQASMKIRYINGDRLYNAFVAGGNAVITDQKYLNKINVFPVPDSDTGTNMASTMHSIIERAVQNRSLKVTLNSITDAAINGARGNSGLIFAQFIAGINREIRHEVKASTKHFAESVKNAIKHTYSSMVNPVEGTMLTVMKDWAEAVYKNRTQTNDFDELFSLSLETAKKSLRETPKKLSVLAKHGVVDAGAKGFVDFLEGIVHFIKKGKLQNLAKPDVLWEDTGVHTHSDRSEIKERYCTEALLSSPQMDLEKLRRDIQKFGSSVIVVGSETKARIHVHTNHPAKLFSKAKDFGSIIDIKADDMVQQFEVSHRRKSHIALVTDSACDIPQHILREHQIHMVPLNLHFKDSVFLDKITITPDQFYEMLKTQRKIPKSSQPSPKTIKNLLSFLSTHYDSIIAVTISDKLSGVYKQFIQAAKQINGTDIRILDSKHLSASEGLVVLRTAQEIKKGNDFKQITESAREWIKKTKILVDIHTLKYMVRGGRVSPLKGLLAQMLNLKPIISLDEQGKAMAYGKSFSRKSNMKKIIHEIKSMSEKNQIWNYAIVHAQARERAHTYASKLHSAIGQRPAYIVDISPVVGAHNGIGAVAIAFMFE